MRFAALGCLFVVVFCLLCGGCTVIYGVSAVNHEIGVRNQTAGASKKSEASLDTMVKIIAQKCQVSGEWLKGNKDFIKELVQGRTGGSLFKSVQEQNSNLTPELFKDIMNSIEGERKRFLRDQSQVVDLVQTHKTYVEGYPEHWVLAWFGNTKIFMPKGDPNTPEGYPIEFQYTFVTSAKTKEMVEKGEENDTKLDFGDQQQPAPAAKPAEKPDKKK
jgi:hypothetical protein